MMDQRDIVRRLETLEAEARELRKMLGNIPDRIPTPTPPPRLRIDHEHGDEVHGTPVFETGIKKPAYLEDQWKIATSARAKSPTDDSDHKLALSLAQAGGHDEGFVWGNVYYAWGTDGWRQGSYDEYGWGLLNDVMGMEKEGFRYVNLITAARWNNGEDDEDRKIGPIWFDSFEDNWDYPSGDNWLLGKMIYDDGMGFWRPAYQSSQYVENSTTGYPPTPPDLPKLHDDHCAIFWNPTDNTYWPFKYVKLESFDVWAVTDGDKVNVHHVAACNRDDINEIWRHLAVLDWSTGDVMGWHDNWLDTLLKSGGSQTNKGWMGSLWALLQPWGARITSLLADPPLTGYWSTLNAEINAFLGALPYTPKCPLPQVGHDGEYHNPSRQSCPQIEGS